MLIQHTLIHLSNRSRLNRTISKQETGYDIDKPTAQNKATTIHPRIIIDANIYKEYIQFLITIS